MARVDPDVRRPPPPPPPPPPKVEESAASAEAKPQVQKAEQDRPKVEETQPSQVVDQRAPPPPGPGAQAQGDQVRERLQAAGVEMKPQLGTPTPIPVADPSKPFTGSGATGRDIGSTTVPLLDQGALAAHRVAENVNPYKSLIAARDWSFGKSMDASHAGKDVATAIETNTAALAKRVESLTGSPIAADIVKAPGKVASFLSEGAGKLASDGFMALETGFSNTAWAAIKAEEAIGGETTKKYSNPAGNTDRYLATLTPTERQNQVKALLERPINTNYPEAYGNARPTRAAVVEAAARKHNLDPNVLSGFLLAEQRDQSQNEDAKDLAAARSIFQANTSIGLAQMTVNTARANNGEMFSDTLDARTRSRLTHSETAKLLTSDEHAIFAAARYIRKVADQGSSLSNRKLSSTRTEYPNLRQSELRNRNWNNDQVSAVASEYTSLPWDDKVKPYWGRFVLEAVNDVRRSGAFR